MNHHSKHNNRPVETWREFGAALVYGAGVTVMCLLVIALTGIFWGDWK